MNNNKNNNAMTREDAKVLLPVIQAYAEGKEIQYYQYDSRKWKDVPSYMGLSLEGNPKYYRIKPTPKYRPFKDAEECWQEMLKHQPFGWAYCPCKGSKFLIREITGNKVYNRPTMQIDLNGTPTTFQSAFYQIRFVDGSPFGVIKED